MPSARHYHSACACVSVRACVCVCVSPSNCTRRTQLKLLNVINSDDPSQQRQRRGHCALRAWITHRLKPARMHCLKRRCCAWSNVSIKPRKQPPQRRGSLILEQPNQQRAQVWGARATHLGGVTSSYPLVTMDNPTPWILRVSLLAGGQETLQAEPGWSRNQAAGCGGVGGEPEDACTLLPFPRDTSRKTTRKGYVFKQLLFQNGVSRGRANQRAPAEAPTPLWAGAQHHGALTSSQDFQFTGIFHNNHHDSL